jgi:hypothetical protein
MTARQDGRAVRSRTEDYEWRGFAQWETHAYRSDQLAASTLMLTPWCEEGSPFPLRHDRPSLTGCPATTDGRITCCVRCVARWNTAVLEAAKAREAA